MDARDVRSELAEVRDGLARALAATHRLGTRGDLSHLSLSVVAMLATDVETARKRHAWLLAAAQRKDAA
jgi:hypothetical protein